MIVPAVTAALGIAGGVLLGRRSKPSQPETIMRRLPRPHIDLSDVGRQAAGAGRQLGRLAGEAESAWETVQKIARAIS